MSNLKKYLQIVQESSLRYDDPKLPEKIGVYGKKFTEEERKVISLIYNYSKFFNKKEFTFDKEKLVELITVKSSRVDDFDKNEYKKLLSKIRKLMDNVKKDADMFESYLKVWGFLDSTPTPTPTSSNKQSGYVYGKGGVFN